MLMELCTRNLFILDKLNQQFYLKVLRLYDKVQKKRPEMWGSGDWFLHHNRAPAHTTLSACSSFGKKT